MRKPTRAKNAVGVRVGEARKRFSPPLTQDALSGKLAAVGVQLDRAAVAKIENGHRRVYDYEVKALAKALNVKVAWLFGVDV
ncbi:MAG: transcriptional regulator [Chthoniobacterales bacterium]|nr:MAG: transcriptional regulator [Chthoniobacterales bacterium]